MDSFALPFPDRSLLFTPNSHSLCQYLSFVSFFTVIICIWASRGCLCPSSTCSVIAAGSRKGGKCEFNQKTKQIARVCAKLYWHNIYCNNYTPETDSQSGSVSRRVLDRHNPLIIWRSNLVTTIATRLSTQPHTCKMGSSIFPMSWLKFASTTRASFPSVPSTEITNGEFFFHHSWKCLPCLSLFYFPNQARIIIIGSFLWESQPGSPSLTLIIAWFWLSHKPQMRMSPCVSNPPLPWLTSYYDLL